MIDLATFGFNAGQSVFDKISNVFKQSTDVVIPKVSSYRGQVPMTTSDSAIKADTSGLGGIFKSILGSVGDELIQTGKVFIQRTGEQVRDKILGNDEATPLTNVVEVQVPRVVEDVRQIQNTEADNSLQRFFELVRLQTPQPAVTGQQINEIVQKDTFQKYLPVMGIGISIVLLTVVLQRRS